MNKEEKKTLKLIEDSLNKKCNGLECKVVKNNIDLRLENIRLKRQIDLMSEELTTPIHSKEWVKDYYERKVENGN